MARSGITREQVYDAADTLTREGQSPTVVAVRHRLGGGSPNNITKWLSEWKERHETHKADTIPPVPETVDGAMRQVWVAAWKEAQGQLDAERDALAAARQAIEQERQQMLSEIERLDADLEHARDAGQAAQTALAQESRAHDQTRAEAREARAIAAERDKRLEGQEAELRDLRRQLQEAVGRVSALEADLRHVEARREEASAELRQTRAERQQLTAELTDALKAQRVKRLEGVERV